MATLNEKVELRISANLATQSGKTWPPRSANPAIWNPLLTLIYALGE